MIKKHSFSLEGMLYSDYDLILEHIRSVINNCQLLTFDDLKCRHTPNNFSLITSFNITYDDEVQCNDVENADTLELEIVANNI